MISAAYFDGASARRHQITVLIGGGTLTLVNAEVHRQFPVANVKLVEPFAGAPSLLNFPDGSYAEVAGEPGKQVLHAALAFRKSFVMRLQERWAAALVAVVAMCGVIFAVVEWGIPAAAERIVAMAPPSMDAAFGKVALDKLDGDMFRASRLSDERIAEVQLIFTTIKPAAPRQPLRLLVRKLPDYVGPNAFALPDGTIVMTDAMVLQVVGKTGVLTQYGRQQLAGVLAHEIGHVQGRHSMRALARSSLTVALAATLFGDFSTVAAGIPALLVRMQHSREMETEADTYAIGLMAQKEIPTKPLGDFFGEMMALNAAKASNNAMMNAMPRWMRKSLSYMSSHPSTTERIKRFGGNTATLPTPP
jgi:Zn-dependent protease with chaperone function